MIDTVVNGQELQLYLWQAQQEVWNTVQSGVDLGVWGTHGLAIFSKAVKAA